MIINEMQRKLATWTATDPNRKVNRLLRLISHPLWLAKAAEISLSSKGSRTPGVDGINKDKLQDGLGEYLEQIRIDLLSGTYKPSPARRIYIPKANGKQRPIGIPTLRDRIVQRAMLMAMEPIWENDFHSLSYGFRPERSVHHAIRTVKLQLTDGSYPKGRWVVEGDLSSYFDTVHHRLLMKYVRKRISCKKFNNLLWLFIKAGHIDKNLFYSTSKGVPQGGVISPLLSNIMLNEFDQYLDKHYLSKKARKDRWYWNHSIKIRRKPAVEENRQWKPAVSYCRYADDFIVIVKGTKAEAEMIRDQCRCFLEEELKLELNMEKTKITHVNDGFTFLGHRIIRKRGSNGKMRPVTGIPKEKARSFSFAMSKELTGDFSTSMIDKVEKLNQKLRGWAQFYRHTDFTAIVYSKIDQIVFWKLAKWLARKYKCRIKTLLIKWFKQPSLGSSKTWVLFGKTDKGNKCGVSLFRLVGSVKQPFRWRLPESNPYLRVEVRRTIASYYKDVAMAICYN
ncbi:MAG: group II intron reverse transcriptase/maturase [Candidatus Marinimicrobia bacterium]|nr:group II intron reverse transcriptase/maturase [Candidatus Neomarinimicrobiota bacterium]